MSALVDYEIYRWYAVLKFNDGSERILASENGIGIVEYDSMDEYELGE